MTVTIDEQDSKVSIFPGVNIQQVERMLKYFEHRDGKKYTSLEQQPVRPASSGTRPALKDNVVHLRK
jgi:hypothetical protein